MINWKTTKGDRALITSIIQRAVEMAHLNGNPIEDVPSLEMDITACHSNGCPLDLKRLLKADDFNFAHDVWGIMRHIDRKTGKLLNCFDPRCSLPQPTQSCK